MKWQGVGPSTHQLLNKGSNYDDEVLQTGEQPGVKEWMRDER